jgi:hypothetical protein
MRNVNIEIDKNELLDYVTNNQLADKEIAVINSIFNLCDEDQNEKLTDGEVPNFSENVKTKLVDAKERLTNTGHIVMQYMDNEIKTYTKLDVAINLTNQAIRMFFHREDEISIHVLVSAANEILTKLMKKQNLVSILGHESIMIKPEYRKEWINARKKVYNFSKHADKDIYETIEFNPKFNWYLIFENINFLQLLQVRRSNEMVYFTMWLWRTQRKLFIDNPKADEFIKNLSIIDEDFYIYFDEGIKIIDTIGNDRLQVLIKPT